MSNLLYLFNALLAPVLFYFFIILFIVSLSPSSASSVMYFNLKIPQKDPIDYIPIALMHSFSDVIASYVPIWPDYTLEENVFAFARSIGGTAFQNFKTKEQQEVFAAFFNSLVILVQNATKLSQKMNQQKDNRISGKEKEHIVIPILINKQKSLLFQYSFNDKLNVAMNEMEELELVSFVNNFINKHILQITRSTKDEDDNNAEQVKTFQKLLLAQSKIAIKRHLNSKEIFINTAITKSMNTNFFSDNLNPIQKKNYNYAEDMKNRKEYFEFYLQKYNNRMSCITNAGNGIGQTEAGEIQQPQHAMSLLGKYFSSNSDDKKLDIFVINLMSSPYRRLYITNELNQANINMSHVHYIPGIDGAKVPTDNLKNVLKNSRDTLIHQGCVGCTLSHISIYRDILKLGLPYALILEDDAVVLPSAKEYILQTINAIYNYIEITTTGTKFGARGDDDDGKSQSSYHYSSSRTMQEQWDIIVTDFGSSKNIGIENLRKMKNNIPNQCVNILYDHKHNPYPFVDITGSPCAHFGAVSYIVSYQGAKKLLKYLLPFENCIDVEILNLIEQGKLRTLALIPFVTGQLNVFEDSRKGSDMVYQYLSWENNELKYTYSKGEQGEKRGQDCFKEKCDLRVYL